jgi:hypothetical protein
MTGHARHDRMTSASTRAPVRGHRGRKDTGTAHVKLNRRRRDSPAREPRRGYSPGFRRPSGQTAR